MAGQTGAVSAEARRQLAVRAAFAVAERFGAVVERAEIVHDSNNTIVGLTDGLVAKVATTTLPGREGALDLEIGVLTHLAGAEAPTVRPSPIAPAAVHEAHGARVILLERLAIVDAPIEPSAALSTIDAVHAALRDMPRSNLPPFLDGLDRATALFDDAVRTPTLSADDRRFALKVGEQLAAWFATPTWDDIVLHGDPWIGGNLVATTDGPRLVDFEATCTGPREWDLSSIGPLPDAPAGVDEQLLDRCRSLRSYTVAAWCWAQPGRSVDVDRAARWHLQVLRDRTATT